MLCIILDSNKNKQDLGYMKNNSTFALSINNKNIPKDNKY